LSEAVALIVTVELRDTIDPLLGAVILTTGAIVSAAVLATVTVTDAEVAVFPEISRAVAVNV
jgi:hypothetical protein